MATVDGNDDGDALPEPEVDDVVAPPRERTADVFTEAASFRDLLLPEPLVRALAAAGFDRPSPVQLAAIPLARAGADLLIQAKSGTGKTLCYAVVAVGAVDVACPKPQALVIAPTRELALQAAEAVAAVGCRLPRPVLTAAFVGGLPMDNDLSALLRPCHVAVGTPGRVLSLLRGRQMPRASIALLVLDEADALAGGNLWPVVTAISSHCPPARQTLALSATFTPCTREALAPLMRDPTDVQLCAGGAALAGVRNYYVCADADATPTPGAPPPDPIDAPADEAESLAESLYRLVDAVPFHQALVFCASASRAAAMAAGLIARGYPASHTGGALPQPARMAALASLRSFRVRVLVSTDLTSRGVDCDRINLVVHVGLPRDSATYLHRCGRTGRYGTRGIAVTLLPTAADLTRLQSLLAEQRAPPATPLPAVVPPAEFDYVLATAEERDARSTLVTAPKRPELEAAARLQLRAAAMPPPPEDDDDDWWDEDDQGEEEEEEEETWVWAWGGEEEAEGDAEDEAEGDQDGGYGGHDYHHPPPPWPPQDGPWGGGEYPPPPPWVSGPHPYWAHYTGGVSHWPPSSHQPTQASAAAGGLFVGADVWVRPPIRESLAMLRSLTLE